MNKNKEGSILLRTLNALSAMVLLFSVIFILIAGFQWVAVVALVCAAACLATPVVMAGEGILEMIMGMLEAILDGILAIFEAIASIFSG